MATQVYHGVQIAQGSLSAALLNDPAHNTELAFDPKSAGLESKLSVAQAQTIRASIGWEPTERGLGSEQAGNDRDPQKLLVRELEAQFCIEYVRDGVPLKSRLVRQIRLLHSPQVWELENFLSLEECRALIALAHKIGFEPSKTSIGKEIAARSEYTSVTSRSRTSWSARVAGEPLVDSIVRRLLQVLNEPDPNTVEPPQVLRYEPGQQFKIHHDGAFRKWTALLYLNEVEEGGETELSALDVRLLPKAGAGILWLNGLSDKQPDLKLLHAGLPVRRGVKYCMPIFVHHKPLDVRVVYTHG